LTSPPPLEPEEPVPALLPAELLPDPEESLESPELLDPPEPELLEPLLPVDVPVPVPEDETAPFTEAETVAVNSPSVPAITHPPSSQPLSWLPVLKPERSSAFSMIAVAASSPVTGVPAAPAIWPFMMTSRLPSSPGSIVRKSVPEMKKPAGVS
jgi:hypothetical protein